MAHLGSSELPELGREFAALEGFGGRDGAREQARGLVNHTALTYREGHKMGGCSSWDQCNGRGMM